MCSSLIHLFSFAVPSDLYVKLYVVNVATQKRIIKKKTRVCRHDREPSFNETFRFPLNPTGHSIQVRMAASHAEARKPFPLAAVCY